MKFITDNPKLGNYHGSTTPYRLMEIGDCFVVSSPKRVRKSLERAWRTYWPKSFDLRQHEDGDWYIIRTR